MVSKSVYLVGPITGLSYDGATDWRENAKSFLKEYGISGLNPMRGKDYLLKETNIEDKYDKHVMSTSRGIMVRDYFDCTKAGVILANFLGATKASIGSAMECAWAYANHTPLIVCMEDDIQARKISDIDSAWLAGLLDGEGCIHISKTEKRKTNGEEQVFSAPSYQIRVEISMTNKEILNKVHSIVGVGVVKEQTRSDKPEHYKQMYVWRCVGQQARSVLEHVYQRLIAKKQQAALAIELGLLQKSRNNLPTKGQFGFQPKPQEVIELEEEIHNKWKIAQNGNITSYNEPIIQFSNPHDHAMIREATGYRVTSLEEGLAIAVKMLNDYPG